MMWRCFPANSPGAIHVVERNVHGAIYRDISEENFNLIGEDMETREKMDVTTPPNIRPRELEKASRQSTDLNPIGGFRACDSVRWIPL